MTIERTIGGNYRITDKLGEGGMGEVFKGFDTMLEREVAIKSLRPELGSRPDVVERFRTEAIALARLNHSHIATVYSFLRDGEQWFLVLEFVRGETLDKIIGRRGKLPWQDAVKLIVQALDGLEHAHRLGVVHRDIKPSNMIISPAGTLKLMDFGIARLLERARLTRTGHLIGTLEYMSPEQIQGRDSDARGDIYSIGVVLYELLTGQLPFQKNSDFDLMRSQVEELPLPPRTRIPQIPQEVESVVLKALEKKPEDRFPSANAFRVALQGMLQTQPGGPQPPPETRFDYRSQNAKGQPIVAEERRPRIVEPGKPIEWPLHGRFKQFVTHYPGLMVLGVFMLVAGIMISVGMNQKVSNLPPLPQPIAKSVQIEPAKPVNPTDASLTPPVAEPEPKKPDQAPIDAQSLPPQHIAEPRPSLPEPKPPSQTDKPELPEQPSNAKPAQKHKLSLANKDQAVQPKKHSAKTERHSEHSNVGGGNDKEYWDHVLQSTNNFLKH
jgi:serine/threonine protein kinase